MSETNDHYSDLLLATLEQMSARIEAVALADHEGRQALHKDIGMVRAEIAAMREDATTARVRLAVLWAAASAIGSAAIIAAVKLLGVR